MAPNPGKHRYAANKMPQFLPSFTVIIVCCNAASLIRETMWSVKRQLYPSRCVVIDLGSVDNTVEIANSLLDVDDALIRAENQNRYAGINKAVSLATSDALVVLDPSDYFSHARVLWIVAKSLSDEHTDAAYGDAVVLPQNAADTVDQYREGALKGGRGSLERALPRHAGLFVKTRVYEELGGFRSDMGDAAEQELLERFFLRYRIKTAYVPHPLIIKRSSSAVSRNRGAARRFIFPVKTPFCGSACLRRIGKGTMPMAAHGVLESSRKTSCAPWLDNDWPTPLAKTDAAATKHRQADSDATNTPTNPDKISSPNKERLFVVTVNYQDEDAVVRLAQSLAQCDIVAKLIVVDHSPTPKLEPWETTFPIEIIRQPNRGYAAGVNRGLRAIDQLEAVALVCNPDVEILTPETLAEAVKALKDNAEWGCLIPAQVDGHSNPIIACRRFYTWKSLLQSRIPFMRKNPHVYRRAHFYLDRDLTQSFDADWGNASSMFLKLSLFPYPICFDERFFLYFEDVDICAQMHIHGYSVRYYPKVVIRHHEQRQSHKDWFLFTTHVKSLLRFVLKYHGLPQPSDLQGKSVAPLTRGNLDE